MAILPSHPASFARTARRSSRKHPISRSEWSRMGVPTNRSMAHPPVIHQLGIPARRSTTASGAGLRQRPVALIAVIGRIVGGGSDGLRPESGSPADPQNEERRGPVSRMSPNLRRIRVDSRGTLSTRWWRQAGSVSITCGHKSHANNLATTPQAGSAPAASHTRAC